MDEQGIRRLLNSCFLAKYVVETMKELPKGFKPRHIHVIEAVYELGCTQDEVRVSDISQHLNITTPSVTKLIQELEELKALEKYGQKEDKRVSLLRLTEYGLELQKKYVSEYHREWAGRLMDLTNQDIETTVRVITRLSESMPGTDRQENQKIQGGKM